MESCYPGTRGEKLNIMIKGFLHRFLSYGAGVREFQIHGHTYALSCYTKEVDKRDMTMIELEHVDAQANKGFQRSVIISRGSSRSWGQEDLDDLTAYFADPLRRDVVDRLLSVS